MTAPNPPPSTHHRLTIQALSGYEVTVRGETSVPRAELANLLFAAGAAVRVSRDAGVAAVEVHRTQDRKRIAVCSHGQNAPLGQGPGSAARGRPRAECEGDVDALAWTLRVDCLNLCVVRVDSPSRSRESIRQNLVEF